MMCAIFFALLAFTSATPLMGWRHVETYGPQEFWNDQDAASHDNIHAGEAIQQIKLYPHVWTGVPEEFHISQMHMNSREFPQIYQHLHQMPMRALGPQQSHETYHHFSGMPIETHEIPEEQQILRMAINTHGTPNIYQGMHGISTPEAFHYLSQMPMSHLASLEHTNMENIQHPYLHQDDVAHHHHHHHETVAGKSTDYHQGVPMQYFNSRLQKFVEEHSEQQVQSLIVHLHQLTQELHHQQDEISEQLSHVESRLKMYHHHHHQHSGAYQQLQQVHHQLQSQKSHLIRQQLAQESVVEYLREALVHKQQHHFGTQEIAHPFGQSVGWY